MAAIPRRPAWRESDPRWRRRILVGVWLLLLVPLMDVLQLFGWASRIPAPAVFDYRGTVLTLDHTFLSHVTVYQPLVFCMGVVLLFARERGRRRARLDWTRRWGVLCSYIVLILGAAQFLFISALVLAGVAALFQSMPLKYQPGVTQLFVDVSAAYLRYGAYPSEMSGIVLVAFSSIVMLLTCVPLLEALRSSGLRHLAMILLGPLALLAMLHLSQVARYVLRGSGANELFDYAVYFSPRLLVRPLAQYSADLNVTGAFVAEAVKWGTVLAIAAWLSVMQLAAWWQRRGTDVKIAPDAVVR